LHYHWRELPSFRPRESLLQPTPESSGPGARPKFSFTRSGIGMTGKLASGKGQQL
jgi:hypothetical protein